MRILIIHNQLWAHYKSKLFCEISERLQLQYPASDLLVVHIALYESGRKVMKDPENIQYAYPYKVLFNKSLDQVSFIERVRSLFNAFNEFKPTVLNITGYFDWAQVLLAIYARQKGVKIVLSSESSSADHHRSFLKEKIKSWIVSHADVFFCFGKTSAEYLRSLGVQASQIRVTNAAVVDEDMILKGYNLAKLRNEAPPGLPELRNNFIFVGRLAPEKNLKTLMDAFIRIQKTCSEAHHWGLIFVGDGDSKAGLEKLLAESPSPEHINFVGGFPWHKVPDWLAYGDVLVLPSTSEPWGLVVNEAMVCGMPVIVSENCGCAPDLVQDSVNGFIFNPKQTDELAEKLQYFLDHPDEITRMGNKSKHLVRRFSSKNVASEMVETYNSL